MWHIVHIVLIMHMFSSLGICKSAGSLSFHMGQLMKTIYVTQEAVS